MNTETPDRRILTSTLAADPSFIACDRAGLALLEGKDPRAALRARTGSSSPTTAKAQHEPSAALRARIAGLPEELRPVALALARQGYDATDALLELYEEAQAVAKMDTRLSRGKKLDESEIARYVAYKANLARARAGLPPREERPSSDYCYHGPEPTPEQLAKVRMAAARAHAEQTPEERAAYARENRS